MATALAKPASATTPRQKRRRARQNLWALLFLSPWIVGFLVFTAGPMLASLDLSFTDYDALSTPHWIGVDNYRRMFTDDPTFIKSLVVTGVYVGVGVPLELAVALAVAVALNRGLCCTCRPCSAAASPSPCCGGASSAPTVWSTTC
jgi:multiple sugar transport system permease protein